MASSAFGETATYAAQNQESQYGPSNAILFHLDRAAALHDAGEYAQSDQALDLAERRMEELYTKSFSRAAGQFFVHDATEAYAGEAYERTLLHIYRALNHLFLGHRDEAAVEARKVSAFLSELREKNGVELTYRDDAFAHLLSAMILEDAGELDNARVSLRWANAAYADHARHFQTPVPQALLDDLLFRDLELEAQAAMAAESARLEAAAAQQRQTEAPPAEPAAPAVTPAAEATEPELSPKEAIVARAEASFEHLDAETGDQNQSAPAETAAPAPVDATSQLASAPADQAQAQSQAQSQDPVQSQDPAPSSAVEPLDWASVQLTPREGSEAPVASPQPPAAAVTATAVPSGEGEVILFHYNGLIPHKVETRYQVAGSEAVLYVNQYPGEVEGQRANEATIAAISQNSIVVAFPEMEQAPFAVRGSWVLCLDGSCQAQTMLVENISAIAQRTMQERIATIRARSIARAAIKYAITQATAAATELAMRQSQATQGYASLAGALVRLIGSTTSAATEQADTRGWLTAPAQIRMARLRLPAGTHDLRVFAVDANGQPLAFIDLPATPVVAGQRTYRHFRTSF
jgi:hypothetical protein